MNMLTDFANGTRTEEETIVIAVHATTRKAIKYLIFNIITRETESFGCRNFRFLTV